jgi:ATP-dependent DNA helicase RecG
VLPFDELYQRLTIEDETTQIEAKRSSEMGLSALKTVSAFANEPGLGGGYLLLGVSRTSTPNGNEYSITGVNDPDKLQNDLANQCNGSFNLAVRPEMTVHVAPDGKRVVVVRIPESDPSSKPIYLKRLSLPKGAFRRIGSADHACSDDDLALFYQKRDETSFDAAIVPGVTVADLDPAAIAEYRATRLKRDAEELAYDDEGLLRAVGATVVVNGNVAVTRAGLLLFGGEAALRLHCPSARIDYILVAGQDWVPDTTQPLRSTEIRQPLMIALPRVASLVSQDLPTTFQLKGKGLRRKEIPAIPERVLREAIVNAVMHRSYRAHEPVQIIRFSNRIEIRNPGHSLVADEELGEPGSKTRNHKIASVLHDCAYAETKGTGVKVMRSLMRSVNMTDPVFRSSREEDLFSVTLLTHHMFDEDTLNWLSRFTSIKLADHEAKALVWVREIGYISNSIYRNINDVDVLTASTSLRRLRDEGLLEAHGKSTATFYGPTSTLLGGNPLPKAPLSRGSKSRLKRVGTLPLSTDLVGLLRRIGERAQDSRLIEIAILRLCALAPLTLAELSRYLQREPIYIQRRFIGRMIKHGGLQYMYPETPNHPRQAYTTAPWMAEIDIPPDPKRQKKAKKGAAPSTLFDLIPSDDDEAS